MHLFISTTCKLAQFLSFGEDAECHDNLIFNVFSNKLKARCHESVPRLNSLGHI